MVQASLSAVTVVFAFDPDPLVPPSRALAVLSLRNALPRQALKPSDHFEDAAVRAAADAGVRLNPKRLSLVGLEDSPSRTRAVTAIYYAASPLAEVSPGTWIRLSRTTKLTGEDRAALRIALDKLRTDTRQVDGALALLGDVFTADDLLRLHHALHGGPDGSERTFRRRIQELRDLGVLKPVRPAEVKVLREENERYRSPAGTGGRPPELLRYSGGGEYEQLASLRARRNANPRR